MAEKEIGFWRAVGESLGLVKPDTQEVEEQRDLVVYGPAIAPSSNRTIGETATPGDALSLVGVYRAVSILATAVEQLPIEVWRGGNAIDTPLVVKSPSVDDNRVVVLQQTVMSLALNGNAYWKLTRGGQYNQVQAIEVLNPLDMVIETYESGKVKQYKYRGKVMGRDEVKHLALLRVPGTPYGLGPIQAAQTTLTGAADVRDYSSQWFSAGNIPSGVLSTEVTLTSEQAALYKEAFEASITGGSTAVLGNGVNYQPIYLTPRDAQFIESQQWTKTEVATLFGIPALYMLADAGNSTSYSNQQQVDVAFLKFGLSQYLVEIEQAFSDLLPRGQEARFNTEGLLRTDTKSRFEAFQIALTSGFMTANEVRAIEGLPPINGGDELAKPSAPTSPNEGGQQA